jgi:hypothetical protein
LLTKGIASQADAICSGRMDDHKSQQVSAREMVRAHAYPVLAAVSTVALAVIAASLVPIARQADHMNQCLAAPSGPGCHRFR